MTFAALLAALFPAAATAVSAGEAPAASLVSESAIKGIEARLEEAGVIEETLIQVPGETIQMSNTNKAYRCWKLALTGSHGRKAREVMQRLAATQKSLAALRGDLTDDVWTHSSQKGSNPEVQRRILTRSASLNELLTAYRQLVEAGERTGLIRTAEKSVLRQQQAILPKLQTSDYTMVYDQSKPGCPPPSGGNPNKPSGV